MGCCGQKRLAAKLVTKTVHETKPTIIEEIPASLLISGTAEELKSAKLQEQLNINSLEDDMAEIITKLSKGIFKIQWPQLKEFSMEIRFIPFIEKMNLKTPFVLLHWQAKPKGLRRWGCYDGTNDEYFGMNWDKLTINSIPKPLQIDERIQNSLPTAVLLFENSILETIGSGRSEIFKIITKN